LTWVAIYFLCYFIFNVRSAVFILSKTFQNVKQFFKKNILIQIFLCFFAKICKNPQIKIGFLQMDISNFLQNTADIFGDN
jgi:hypothetical protein